MANPKNAIPDKLQQEPAYRAVANAIERHIMSGSIKPGDPLPSETDLALQLGVNRSTLREGIRLLEENGLVRRRDGGKRLFASIPRTHDLGKRISRAMVLHEVTFEELWETVMVLEPFAAEHAAQRALSDDVAAIEENLRCTREALGGDHARIAALDIEFHSLVAEAAHNRALILSREALGQLFYPAFDAVFSRLNAGNRLLFAHEAVANAIRSKNVKEAREWMRRHIVDFRRGYELASLDISAPVGDAG